MEVLSTPPSPALPRAVNLITLAAIAAIGFWSAQHKPEPMAPAPKRTQTLAAPSQDAGQRPVLVATEPRELQRPAADAVDATARSPAAQGAEGSVAIGNYTPTIRASFMPAAERKAAGTP